MSAPAAEICVAHLVRRSNDLSALRAFLESYARNPAGAPHELLVIFKGFDGRVPPEYEALLRGVVHERRFIPDRGFDVDAYFDTARAREAKYFCFMNSYSVILAEGWLLKMHQALVKADAGAAGATGSWQSIFSSYPHKVVIPPSVHAAYPVWKRFLLRWLPFLRPLRLRLYRWTLRGKFEPFPNYHLRTNAFLIPREVALRIQVNPLRKKFEAYEFESGSRGLTRQILQMGKRVLVVGRDGAAYDMENWDASNTFWRRRQENLLVADNQTRKYDSSDLEGRAMYSAYAWGERGDPGAP